MHGPVLIRQFCLRTTIRGDPMMKLGPTSSFVLTWILAVALTASPVLAQNPTTPVAAENDQPTPTTEAVEVNETTAPLIGEDSHSEGTPVPIERPVPRRE